MRRGVKFFVFFVLVLYASSLFFMPFVFGVEVPNENIVGGESDALSGRGSSGSETVVEDSEGFLSWFGEKFKQITGTESDKEKINRLQEENTALKSEKRRLYEDMYK